MINIKDTNLECLKRRYKDIYDALFGYKSDETDCQVVVEEINNRNVLYVIKDGGIIQLDSLYDTEVYAKIWSENIIKNMKFDSKIFIFGFGNGIFIRRLLENVNESNSIYVYEPDLKIISAVIENYDISDILQNKRFVLSVGSLLNDSIRNVYSEIMEFTDIDNSLRICLPNYSDIYENGFEEFINGLELAYNTVNADLKFLETQGEYENRNTFNNFKYLVNSKSLDNLIERIPDNIPAIIVAAGPSLSKNIEELKRAKGKSVIICIDAAMRALATHNITPDFCISVDLNKEQGHFDKGDSNDVPLICAISSTKKIMDEHKSYKFFYDTLSMYVQEFFKVNDIKLYNLPSGGTVANNAMSAAMLFGCKTIIFVGQDLAYTNNQTHAEGTVKGELKENPNDVRTKCYVKDINGNPILTCGEFKLYKQWIEETITRYPEFNYINATEGGAGIVGCEHMTLREAIDRECVTEFNVKDAVNNCHSLFNEENKQKFIDYIYDLPNQFENIMQLAQKGISTYESMLKLIYSDKYHSKQFGKLFDTIKDINRDINSNKAASYVFNKIQAEMDSNVREIYAIDSDERSELISLCNKGIASFERIAAASKEIIDYAIEKLNEDFGK